MKTCKQCGHSNEDASRHCDKCGAALDVKTAGLTDTRSAVQSSTASFTKRTRVISWSAAWGFVLLVVAIIKPSYIVAAPLFPIGLCAVFLDSQNAVRASFVAWSTGAFILGWTLYAAISVIIFSAKNNRTFITAFVILCLLLALNICGCERVLTSASGIQ